MAQDKGFWRDLEQAFLAVGADELRADYAGDRSSAGHWELKAWSGPVVRDRFEVEAARAGSALRQRETSSTPRDRWLNLVLKKKPEWLELSPIEDNAVNADDSERRTVTGTIYRVIEKSALMCRLLQSEAGLAIDDEYDDSPIQATPVAITEMEGTAGTIFEGLSATGIANFRTADSQEAYQDAYADFAPATDDAFTADIRPGKPSSHLGRRAVVVHLSKSLEKLTEKYFDKFAAGIDDVVREAAAEGPDPVLTPIWRQAVIQDYAKKLWRDVDAVWDNWLAQISKMTGGAAFGQRVLPIGDPEYEILTAHRRRMKRTLYSIAHRYSIPKDTIPEILELDEFRRMHPPGRYTGDRLAREVEGEPAPKANQDTVDGATLGARESAPNAVLPSAEANDSHAGPASDRGPQGLEDPGASDKDSPSRRSEPPSDVPRDQGAQVPQKSHNGGKPARRNAKYEEIDLMLKLIAEAKPVSHEEVFRLLDTREAPLPNREPFKSAHGWLKGFQRNTHTAGAWLSQAWGRLGLPPFLKGPKK